MVGEGLFSQVEARPSSGSATYFEGHRNMTPSKTTRPNLNPLISEDVRRMDFFDDPVTFVRELSTVSLGVPELSKFEKKIYRSMYLNNPECLKLLNTHYKNLMMRYSPKLDPLLSQYRTEVTLDTLNHLSLFSSDHLKSLTILVILGNHYNLDMEGLNSYLLNLMRLLYKAVTSSKVDPVDKARMFYVFLTESENVGRAVVLYMLLLSTYEKYLWFSDGDLADDDMFSVFSYMICSFVERILNGEVPEYKPQEMGLVPPMSSRMDMLERHLSVVGFLLKLKVSLPNSSVLLSCMKAFRSTLSSGRKNRTMLVWTTVLTLYLDPNEVTNFSLKSPKLLFEEIGNNQNHYQFTHVVSALEHCFNNLELCKYVEDSINISRFVSLLLFNSWKFMVELKDDLVNEMLLLANIMLDNFPKIQPAVSKFISQFPNKDKGDLMVLDNVEHTGDSKLSQGVQKSVETLFNIALLGKSRLQMNASVFLSKLLMNADVTLPIPKGNRVKYTQVMVELLGFVEKENGTSGFNHKYYTAEYTYNNTEYSFAYKGNSKTEEILCNDHLVRDLSKLTMMSAMVKYCWKEFVSYILSKVDPQLLVYDKQDKVVYDGLTKPFGDYQYNNLNYGDKPLGNDKYKTTQLGDKQYYKGDLMRNGKKSFDRDVQAVLNFVKNLFLGSSSKETLYSMLSSGSLPAKMLSYEALTGLSPTPDTLVMCAMMGLYNRYPDFTSLFNKYLSMKNSYSYSKMSVKSRNSINYMVLLLDMMVTNIAEVSDLMKQKLFKTLLINSTSTVSDLDREKYEQMVKSVKEYKSETQRWRTNYDHLMLESNNKKEEHNQAMAKMKSEMSSMSDKHKSELNKMKEVVSKTNSTIQQLEQAMETVRSENQNLKRDNSRLFSERDNMKNELTTMKNKITQYQKELDRVPGLVRDNEVKSSQLKKMQNEIDRRSEEVMQANSNSDRLCRMLICLADKHKTSLEAFDKEKEMVKKLTQDLTQFKSKVEKLDSELKEKQRLLFESKKYCDWSDSEVARLKDEVARREEVVTSANMKLNDFKEKVTQLTHSLQKKSDAMVTLEQRYSELERELHQRRQQLIAIESAFNSRPL